MDTNLDKEILKDLPFISKRTKYWLIRTNSGYYYDYFVRNNCIAIGWNEISIYELNQLHQDSNNKELKRKLACKINYPAHYNERSRNTYRNRSLKQLLKFAYEIKKGDIVIIPNNGSFYLSVGVVEETPIVLKSDQECDYEKRKSIRWIKKDMIRASYDYSVCKFIHSHQTVNNITEYSEKINSILYDFYFNESKAYLVLRVKKKSDISAVEMSDFYSNMVEFIQDFNLFEDPNGKDDNLTVKFQLQSPGTIIFASIIAVGLIGLGAATVLAGGDFSGKFKVLGADVNLKIKPNSLLDKIAQYKMSKVERAERIVELQKQMKHFEIDPSKDIRKLIKAEAKSVVGKPINGLKDLFEINNANNETNN